MNYGLSETFSFDLTRGPGYSPEQKALLEQWAGADDRSASYILRQILTREAQRRKLVQRPEQKPLTQQAH